jgi:hypothetical protein
MDVACRQLTEYIMSAALCAKEVVSIAHEVHGAEGLPIPNPGDGQGSAAAPPQRPSLDESTLSVNWKGRMLHLGHTQAFWLLARLTRSADRYVTHVDLLQEIWDDEFADPATLRAGVRRLRIKLRGGGMGDLADAIIGHHGRYMLSLSGPSRHTDVTAMSH